MRGTKGKHLRQDDNSVCENIIKAAKENSDFRKTVGEGYISELALMSVLPGKSIGREVHDEADEIFFIVEGKATLSIGNRTKEVRRHDVIFVQSGEPHDLRNIGHKDLKVLCFCAPPSTGTTGMHESGKKAAEERMPYLWKQ
jgi:mannose-6-phosphate isomerase-like protein (cupin superfamily)